jgi:hypothetical protein
MTYKFSTDDVPVLGICLEVSVPHQLIIFQDSHPIRLVFLLLFDVYCGSFVLLYCYRVGVEVLKNNVLEIRHL